MEFSLRLVHGETASALEFVCQKRESFYFVAIESALMEDLCAKIASYANEVYEARSTFSEGPARLFPTIAPSFFDRKMILGQNLGQA